tara:strand:- start:697 stop:1860 length:1164 start_codon:yes stop_codon:yes gene_type:complete
MKPLFAVSITTFNSFALLSLISLVIPLYLVELGTSLVEIGLVIASRSLVMMFLAVPFGIISDRKGRNNLVLLGLLTLTGAAFLLIFATTSLHILAAFMVFGVGWSAFEPSISALVMDESDHTRIARSYGTFATFLQGGFSLGPVLAGVLMMTFGIKLTFLVAAVTAAASSLMWWVMMKKTKWRPTTKVNTRPKILSVFKQFRKNTLVLVGWAAVFPSFILIGSFEGFVPVYARTVGMSPLIIGALFSVSFVVGMATRIPLGALLDRTKHKVYLIAGGLASAAVMMAIIPFFTDPAILVVIFSLTAIARAMPNVGGNSLIGLGTTTDNRGAANGVTGICRNLGLAIGPMLLGVVASAQGFQIAFPVLATLGVGGAITVCLIGRNANRR